MLKSATRNVIAGALALVLLSVMAGLGVTQSGPISKEVLVNALKELRRGDSQDVIVKEVRARGVDFELTKQIETELRRAGGAPRLINAVRDNFRPSLSPIPASTPIRRPAPTPNPTPPPQRITNHAGIEFVWIPPGSFMMGSGGRDRQAQHHVAMREGVYLAQNTNSSGGQGGQKERRSDSPQHQVTIREGFFMGKYEVTQAQWQAVMGHNPSDHKGHDLPVEKVSWYDAQDFIQRLNAKNDGYTYRLPSEAEWEYTARAGTTGDYAGELDAMAWYASNSDFETHPVGLKHPNAFGLFDMHGNVWEWCQDNYHKSYVGAPADGSAWLSEGEQKRVARGGSWGSVPNPDLRSAERNPQSPDLRYNSVGFRVVAVARK
jgi:formylglycine-generating enzyme required for sulfatase activity